MSSSKLPASLQSSPGQPFLIRASPQGRQPLGFHRKLMGWFKLNSFGGRLFWIITLTTLAGFGGMFIFFSEMLKDHVEDQVSSSLDGKVNAIASVAETAETLAYGLGVSATTLHERGAQYSDTYREIIFQLFERRPEFVTGLGLGQSKNGIVVDQPWVFHYYSVIQSEEDTSFDQDTIVYEDLADNSGEFYPNSQRYQDYFLPQASLWTDPYQGKKGHLLTYYLPMFGYEGKWLGTILVDIDSQYLSNLLDDSVFRQAGHFVLLTHSGDIIADSANPNPSNQWQSYQDIKALEPLWQQIDLEGTGFLKSDAGYWSYATVPGQDWLLLGFVPYNAVYNRLFVIMIVTMTVVMGLLTTILSLAVRRLNSRLKPLLLQCEQLPPAETHNLLAEWQQQDELDQLSLAFFQLLEQLNVKEDAIHQYENALAQETRQTDQVIEQFLDFANRIEEEADNQQMLIQRAQQLVANRDYQSVDIHLDALCTMGRALDGDLKRMPSGVDPTELFTALGQRIATLTTAIEDMEDFPNKPQLQSLVTQLAIDMASLKAYGRRQPSLKNLQYQTSNIAQAGQAAIAHSRAIVAVIHSLIETLVKLETISTAVNGQVKCVSDMLWLDLGQRKGLTIQEDRADTDTMQRRSSV